MTTRFSLLLPACALVALIGAEAAAQPGAAPADAQPARGTVSFRTGLFQPADATFGQVYSGWRAPIVVQADWMVFRRVAVFGGVRHVAKDGSAIVESTGRSASDPTHLSLTSVRGGALFVLPSGPWEFRAGGGATLERYSEDWPAAGISQSDSAKGWLIQASLSRIVWRRVALVGAAEFSRVKTAGSGDESAPAPQLGGFDVTFGVAYRF